MQSNQTEGQEVAVILHADRDRYLIGESIGPKLEIRNDHEFPIEIAGGFEFSWDRCAFSPPNAAHLIGPDGQDRMIPYQRPVSFAGYGPPIKAEAEKSEWRYVPISSHLHLRQCGRYTFWLELLDSLGELHRTNRISFELLDVESSVLPELLDLTLEASQSFAMTEPVLITATFTSKSDRPIIFLKPQQDSFDAWVNPMYQFTVLDPDGRSLALARRDGTMATPVYDETTKFTVEPRQSHSESLRVPVFPEMCKGGDYRVRLTYIVREKAIGKGGDVLDRFMNWEERVFIGRIESNEVVLHIN
jgi:hypothetical protein